jgi:hypothetical protein
MPQVARGSKLETDAMAVPVGDGPPIATVRSLLSAHHVVEGDLAAAHLETVS